MLMKLLSQRILKKKKHSNNNFNSFH